jgi:hypothetical protein
MVDGVQFSVFSVQFSVGRINPTIRKSEVILLKTEN